MAIARFPSIVLDCPDPLALATFYGTMLDWKVDTANFDESDGWIDVKADYGQCLSFQGVEDYKAPSGPARTCRSRCTSTSSSTTSTRPRRPCIALGATKHEHQPGTTFRVMLDPAGHPFCLCLN